ncbi:hypothetical protein [Flavobacterium sp. N2038]|uniref:hypothetical protein n=1 Tax=Flavobacterium sp. N2038 TaxID=2986829 RepID=UPI002223FD90|nr:hypothetical protein [Flavobacterium sp. N2038]
MKNVIVFFIIIIFSSCKEENKNTVSVKETKSKTKKVGVNQNLRRFYISGENVFLGDSTLAVKNYFNNLTDNTGYLTLKKQNDVYLNNYLDFRNNKIPQIFSNGNAKLKLEKQSIIDKTKYRIVLYSFINDKKIDSIEFYRNVSHLENEPSNYTCLSYLDLKNRKVWQIKYFSSSVDKSVNYILYERNKIMENGKIETDSLYYLDELQDVQMGKYKLYY